MNALHEIIQAIENGDIEKITSFLDKGLLNEDPDSLYEIAELLTNYGYLNEASRIIEHLLFLFPEENQLKKGYGTLFELMP